MAISAYCSLKFPAPPSTPSPSSSNSTTPQISCATTPKERSWRNRCLLGLTCAIISIDGGDFAAAVDRERAMAMDTQTQSSTININAPRWSDKRACLPWQMNSLETIVPENLPRPTARRRWEAAGFSERAPAVKVVVKSSANGCFNL